MTPLQAILLRLFCIWVPVTILLLGPEDSILKYVWKHRFDSKGRLRVWHYETLAVMVLVAAVVVLSGDDPTEWVGFAALTLAHGRNSVMFRFSEAQRRASQLDPHHVQCWAWAGRYFLLAECFWAAYFILHRSWAALAGVGIFLGYGQWRKWYGRRKKVRWDGIDLVKCDQQKRKIQRVLGITSPINDGDVYCAIIKHCEELEHTGKYTGNGHHLAQRLAKMVSESITR